MTPDDRAQALREVIDFLPPVDEKIARLRSFPWDSEAPLVILERRNVTSILDRYLGGGLSAEALEVWANTLEGRDDLGYDEMDHDLLKQIVFELANPLLTNPTSQAKARQWREALHAAD